MNSFDFTFTRFLNIFSLSSELFNVTMVTLVDNNLITGGITVSVFGIYYFEEVIIKRTFGNK